MEKFPIGRNNGGQHAHLFLPQGNQSNPVRMSTDLSHYEQAQSDTDSFLKTLDDIRNYIATHEEGITRDQTIAEQLVNILLCKLHFCL